MGLGPGRPQSAVARGQPPCRRPTASLGALPTATLGALTVAMTAKQPRGGGNPSRPRTLGGSTADYVSRAASAFAFTQLVAMIEICGLTPEAVGKVEASQTTTSRTS